MSILVDARNSLAGFNLYSYVWALRLDCRVLWELHHLYCWFFTVCFLYLVYLVLFLAWWEMRGFFGVGFMVWGSLLLLWSMCDLIFKSLLRSIIYFLQLSVVFFWNSLNKHYVFQLFLNNVIVLRDVIDITVTIEVWNLYSWFSRMCSAVSKKIKLLFLFLIIEIIYIWLQILR